MRFYRDVLHADGEYQKSPADDCLQCNAGLREKDLLENPSLTWIVANQDSMGFWMPGLITVSCKNDSPGKLRRETNLPGIPAKHGLL